MTYVAFIVLSLSLGILVGYQFWDRNTGDPSTKIEVPEFFSNAVAIALIGLPLFLLYKGSSLTFLFGCIIDPFVLALFYTLINNSSYNIISERRRRAERRQQELNTREQLQAHTQQQAELQQRTVDEAANEKRLRGLLTPTSGEVSKLAETIVEQIRRER